MHILVVAVVFLARAKKAAACLVPTSQVNWYAHLLAPLAKLRTHSTGCARKVLFRECAEGLSERKRATMTCRGCRIGMIGALGGLQSREPWGQGW